MSQVCACGEYFNVNDSGELCLNPGTMGLREMLTFASPGTYQFERSDYPWLARVRVRVQGGGGGSAGADSDAGGSVWRAGGAGGGYSESVLDVSLLGAIETIVVGEGGDGGVSGSAGVAGGTSSFGGLVAAYGGAGSSLAMTSDSFATTTSATGGPTGNAGQIAIGGASSEGAIRLTAGAGIAGAGGDSFFGHGGFSRATGGAGTAPRGWGAGAGGSASANGAVTNGAAGGSGLVVVELYG